MYFLEKTHYYYSVLFFSAAVFSGIFTSSDTLFHMPLHAAGLNHAGKFKQWSYKLLLIFAKFATIVVIAFSLGDLLRSDCGRFST